MVSRTTWQAVAKYGQGAKNTASSFLRSGWTKAAVAATGTGLAFSEMIYPKYVETKAASNRDEVETQAAQAATEARTMYAREYILERERAVGQSPFSAGSTPSGQFNFNGIIALVVIGVLGYIAVKHFSGGKK